MREHHVMGESDQAKRLKLVEPDFGQFHALTAARVKAARMGGGIDYTVARAEQAALARRRARRHGIRTLILLGVGLAAGFALGWSAKAGATEYHAVLHGLSWHSGERVETRTTVDTKLCHGQQCRYWKKRTTYRQEDVVVPWQNVNVGAGLRAAFSPQWSAQIGAYRNSYDRTSVYALGEWTPLRSGPLSAGVFAALTSGYEYGNAAGGFVARLQGDRLGAALRFAPHVSEKQSGAVAALEVSWRL